jgi:Bacterial membrane protein YfhO
MRHGFALIVIFSCFGALFLICYAPAMFMDRQFAYRDAGNYYYPLYKRVQAEWDAGRWPLWEPEENAGMPLLGNPTAAVLYPGKLVFAILPYAWGARTYILAHSVLAFLSMLALMRSWGASWFGSALSALGYGFGAPILFQYCNIIYLIGAAWLPLGIHAVDGWVRLGRRWCLLELAIVLSMQVLGGDPQSAYHLGLASVGYASFLAWNRATLKRRVPEDHPKRSPRRRGLSLVLVATTLVVWCVLTVALAQWLPRLRGPGKPPSALPWALWVPVGVDVAWGLAAVSLCVHWRRRGWRFPLGITLLGLAGSAVLAASLSSAQLLPVIEFTQGTGRSVALPRETYLYTIEPVRLIELAWPNILGMPLEGKSYWGDAIMTPGGRSKGWIPSLYLGGLFVALALSSLALRSGHPWRVWLTVIGLLSLLGSLGQYTSPIWVARAVDVTSRSPTFHHWLADLGPMDGVDSTTIRPDGYLRDCDGGFYWWLTTVFPGFRQFRYPAKLFTLTAMAIAALAGFGWDRLGAERGRGIATFFILFLVLTLTALSFAVFQKERILASFHAVTRPSMFGPVDAAAAHLAIIRSLGQAAIVFAAGLLLVSLARARPRLAGSAVLVLTTADLAMANSRYILTVHQSLFEAKPEALTVIENAERADPSPGPFRIQRMQQWFPSNWANTWSDDRISEHVSWARDTLHPKWGIEYGQEHTYAIGVAQLHDYDQFFISFYCRVSDGQLEKSLGIAAGQMVVYQPRRAYDIWNTRYFIVPFSVNGWRDPQRGSASFAFQSKQLYPDPVLFTGPQGTGHARSWAGARDFKVIRNLVEYPRCWIVHEARATVPATPASLTDHREIMEEILYAGDPIWNNATQHVYDPRELAWVNKDDLSELRPYLSGRKTMASETVRVTYPDPQQGVLEVNVNSSGLVILADVFYPGWELTIDGKSAPIYRVNGLMRGAAVPPGHHQLIYTYAPQSFRVGRLVSLAGLAALLILSLACARWPVDPILGARTASRSGEKTVPFQHQPDGS